MKLPFVLGAALASGLLASTQCSSNGTRPSEQRATDASKLAPRPVLPRGAPAEQVQALIDQYAKAMAAFRTLFDAAKTEEEQEKLEPLFPDPGPFAKLLLQVVDHNPKDPAAIDALIWAITRRSEVSIKARAILVRDHLMSPKIGPLCLQLRHEFQNADSTDLLRRVLAENPGKQAQAHAAFGLAKLLQSRSTWARRLQKAEAIDLAKWEKEFGKKTMNGLKAGDALALEKETEELLARIRRDPDFADTSISYGEGKLKLGDLAGRELFELRRLQPGMLAPEIAGEDIDGKPMKLSDFRGRVVLLDFWGIW